MGARVSAQYPIARLIRLTFWISSDSSEILSDLNAGTTVICDRYAFSGIAFSAVKVDQSCQRLSDLR